MRLLQRLPNGSFKLVSFADDAVPPYAILSHTWIDGQEVTYTELVAGTRTSKAGYKKIDFCTERAAVDAVEYSWVDTCCIDKSTSDEVSTAINSMFGWYQRATKCYVYLSDVSVPGEVTDAQAFQITWIDAFRRSRWFTRGWTLQELLAPATVEFFSREGKPLGSKISLEQEIHEITGIAIGALRGQNLAKFGVEQRMKWAAKRTTTRKEDMVYCLLGVFGVFLPLIYGEGEAHATQRLRAEIEKRQKGRGAESLDNVPGTSLLPTEQGLPDKELNALSYLVIAISKKRTLHRTRASAAVTRPTCARLERPSPHDDLGSRWLWEVRTCNRIRISCAGETRESHGLLGASDQSRELRACLSRNWSLPPHTWNHGR